MGPTTLPASHYSPLGMRYTSAVALLMLMMIVQLSSYIVWALAALSHPLYHLAFRPELIFQILSMYGLAIVGGLLVLLVCWRMHQQQRWDMRLSYVATGLYSGIMLFAGYGIGTLTLVYGFALAGVPFLLLFLLPRPAVMGMVALSLLSWLVLSSLSLEGYIPYAPSYSVSMIVADRSALRFQFWSQVFYLAPLALATGVGGYFIRTRWQQLGTRLAQAERLEPISQALNRPALLAHLEARLPAGTAPLSVVMLRLEQLPELQQRCGFVAVDQMLRQGTEQIRTQLRTQDEIGRLGDDEWVLVMEGASARVAAILTDRCRQAMLQQTPVCREGTGLPLRIAAVVLSLDAQHREALSSQQLLDCLRHELAQRGSRNHWLTQVQVNEEYLLYGLSAPASPPQPS